MLIPTKNGAETLTELLAMLSIQTVLIDEILIVDSGSTDNTKDVAKSYGANVISIDPATFDHGGTRTIICKKAMGEILVFFTQDAIPKRRNTIETLIAPLIKDKTITTSYGRQLPNFTANHFATNLRHFNYPERSNVRELKDKIRLGLKTVFTSNSFASYRKSSLDRVGYFQDGLIFGEDTVAVGRILLDGEKIAYVAEAVVYHSHNYSPIEEFRRYFDIGVLHTCEIWLLETFGSAEGQGMKYLKHETSALIRGKCLRLLPELCSRVLMKYLGYKLGRYYKLLPKRILPCFSMHRSWWIV